MRTVPSIASVRPVAASDSRAAAGWRVRAYGRRGVDAPGVEVHVGAIGDVPAPGRAAAGADVIVNALNPPYPDWSSSLPAFTNAVIAAARSSGATVIIPGNVYNFGSAPPAILREDTPWVSDHRKARLRIEMERTFEASGVRTIVLRGGDFIDARPGDNWFEGHITKHVARGCVMYPGPLDAPHAWAFLPDMARAARMLANRLDALPPFAAVNFPGDTLTGAELIAHIEAAVGAPLKRRSLPWPVVRLMGLVSPMMREVAEMRYLWRRPHQLCSERFEALLPEFAPTPPREAIRAALDGAAQSQTPLAASGGAAITA